MELHRPIGIFDAAHGTDLGVARVRQLRASPTRRSYVALALHH